MKAAVRVVALGGAVVKFMGEVGLPPAATVALKIPTEYFPSMEDREVDREGSIPPVGRPAEGTGPVNPAGAGGGGGVREEEESTSFVKFRIRVCTVGVRHAVGLEEITSRTFPMEFTEESVS